MKLRSAITIVAIGMWTAVAGHAQTGRQQVSDNPVRPSPQERESVGQSQPDGETELRMGTALTRKGSFAEAIPHLQTARGRVANEYAAAFNLALCYVGTNQFDQAVQVLSSLRDGGHDNADVYNLLAQAQIGDAQPQEAWKSFQKAVLLTPENEKLYLFLADACMARRDHALGLRIVNLGLQNLPQSARLHYERAVFFARLDQLDRGKVDFGQARALAPNSDIVYLATAHQEFLQGNMAAAIRVARESLVHGYENPVLLAILGEALMRTGAVPGQSEFSEAETALQKAVTLLPGDPGTLVALGKLYLMADKLDDAIAQLEKARQLEPDKPSAYASLAKAYQRHGDVQLAQKMLAVLAEINQRQAEKIGSATGDRKSGYVNPGVE
jgi:Flp pilus assembly protein TadD